MNKYYQHFTAFALTLLFGSLVMSCQPSYTYVAKLDKSSTGVKASLQPDANVKELIAPYKMQLDSQMNAVIGTAAVDLPRDLDTLESMLGNFSADLMLEQTLIRGVKADMAAVTLGGLRVPLSKGPITTGVIFELMPFENELVVVTVKGTVVKEMLERIVGKQNISLANAVPTFRRGTLVSAKVGGEPFDENKEYRVVVSDYLASGGDYMDYLIGAPQESVGLKLRDAIIDHIKQQTAKGKKISATKGDRVIFE